MKQNPLTVIQPLYASGYVACALGNFKGLPASIGAITFKMDDPNTLLVATYADTKPAMIYSVPAIMESDLYTTEAYKYTQLMPTKTLYLPIIAR